MDKLVDKLADWGSCDFCNMFRKVKHCEKHDTDGCRNCKCIECMSSMEQIKHFENKIHSLLQSVYFYKGVIRDIERENNITKDNLN